MLNSLFTLLKGRVLYIALVVLLLADLSYSFLQHYHMPLDGDIAESVVPVKWMPEVFNDPFGFKVLLEGKHYHNPNRYFCHGAMFLYLRSAPLAMQQFLNPVESVYFSIAIFKTLLQFALIALLSWLIARTNGKHRLKDL